jgi:hypothetical protein
MRKQLKLDPALEARLQRMRLRLESPDRDTLAARRVPANQISFSKPRPNLLHGVARLLAGRKTDVLAVSMGSIMACTLFDSEREMLLTSLLREARKSRAVLALEEAEWAIVGAPRGLTLLREALDRGASRAPARPAATV